MWSMRPVFRIILVLVVVFIQQLAGFPVGSPGMPQTTRNLYNLIFCHGTGLHLSHLPGFGIQCFGSETNGFNLEVLDNSNGKSYMKKIMPKYEEVVIEEDASLSFGAPGTGDEFTREPLTSQNDILLYISYNNTKLYLQADTTGTISLVSQEYKEFVEANCARLIQQCGQLRFDIIAVDSLLVTMP